MIRAAIIMLMLASCTAPHPSSVGGVVAAAPAPAAQDPLQGFKWRAVEITGMPVIPASEVYLRFEGERVHGRFGCNGYSGGHEVLPDRHIRFGTLHGTRMGCFSDDIEDQEHRFGRILSGTMRYAIESRGPEHVQLTLTAADGRRLIFRREPWAPPALGPPPPPLPRTASSALLDREWRAVSIHGTPVTGGNPISLRFADGSVAGHGGCNSFGGPFNLRAAEQKIRFGALTATRRACTDPAMNAQERRFLDELQETMIYSIDKDGLLTLTAANMRTIVFRQVAAEAR